MQATEPQWMPIAEAARELGVSIDTARRRIKRGELVAERRETPQGFTWWICLTGAKVGTPAAYADAELGSTPPRQHAQVGSMPMRHSEAAHLAELVRELQGEVLRRTEAAATWQARAEFLAGQLEAARDEIKALAAPTTTPDVPGAAESADPTTEPPVPQNGAWWRRWLLAVYG
jgi:hypothetical protein